MAERMMNREEQIEALAREMEHRLMSFSAPPESYDHIAAYLCAVVAIELAEATRREAGERVIACPDGTAVVDVYHAVRAMPLPIADGGGDG